MEHLHQKDYRVAVVGGGSWATAMVKILTENIIDPGADKNNRWAKGKK